MKKSFSLILATVNRKKEVEEFLKSIIFVNYPLEKIEIIVIDQNKDDILKDIILKYNKKLNIIHIKSKEVGLSKNRNKGLEIATCDIVAFPDDDCKYLKNTLLEVDKNFNNNKELDCIIGRIIDQDGLDCIKKWSKKFEKITPKNFYTKMSSITMFKKNKNVLKFDENLGAGAKFGSSEDADILYRMLKKGKEIYYDPRIVLFHPRGKDNFSSEKAYSYGLGHGVFIRKNLDINTIKIYFMGLVLINMRILKSIIFLDNKSMLIWINSLKGRIKGIGKNDINK